MAYNRKYLLNRIIDIQKTTLEHKDKEASQKWIYENLIAEKYLISERTYYNYLGTNAKRELNELEKAKHETK